MSFAFASEERTIGQLSGRAYGPSIVIVAGLHGNETAGVEASQRVLATLTQENTPIRGDLRALRGNVSALQHGRRFLDLDLNRLWMPEQVELIRRSGTNDLDEVECRELVELYTTVNQTLQGARGRCLILDLHSSSSESTPFTLEGHYLKDERDRQILDVPAIIDTSGFFRGTFMSYFRSRGCLASIFEAGQNFAHETVRNHETAIWTVLAGMGLVQKSDIPETISPLDVYHNGDSDLPATLELFYRHAVLPEDEFRMLPGFRNFDPVQRGQPLGEDRRGPVNSPDEGRVFLPLYQSEGEDGFFLVRDIPQTDVY